MAIPHRQRVALAEARERRDDAVQEFEDAVIAAWKKGGGMREVGEAAGMSHQGVSKLLARRGVRAPIGDGPEEFERLQREGFGERPK